VLTCETAVTAGPVRPPVATGVKSPIATVAGFIGSLKVTRNTTEAVLVLVAPGVWRLIEVTVGAVES
jgi:hypothetical protein